MCVIITATSDSFNAALLAELHFPNTDTLSDLLESHTLHQQLIEVIKASLVL